jgi:CPA2 family monovalent cation:H+ antiporter-2
MCETLPMLTDFVLIVAISLPVLFLFRRLNLPPTAGFIMTGLLIGPYGLGWIKQIEHVEVAAEVGVVLLLFSIGLEVSLTRLLQTSKRFYLIAAGQIVGTALCGSLAAIALGFGTGAAVVVGFVVAMSSSAIVLKGLADREELESPLGRLVVTICLTQDFAIVPMLLVIGFMGDKQADLRAITQSIAAVGALGIALYLAARHVLPQVIRRLMVVNTPEVLLLFTILVMFGTAWLTSLVGLSLAIGAFAAGLILSETEYYPQIYAEVAPFRALFSSLFFVAVGMLLDLKFVATHPAPVLLFAVGILAAKTLIVLFMSTSAGISLRVSLQGGLYLAQIGEFSFLLIAAATQGGLVTEGLFQYLIAATSLTLMVTPLIMQYAPRIAWSAHARFPWFMRAEAQSEDAPKSSRPVPAVLIVGYGVNGHNVARVLKESSIYYEILDSNPETVRRAREDGELIHYGEVARTEVLRQIEVEGFDSLVLAISDAGATRRAVSLIRGLNPRAHLVVRTRFVKEVEELERLGANVVVPEEFETSLRIFSELLHHYRIPPHIIQMQIEVVRGHSYGLLRTRASGTVVESIQELLLRQLVEAVPIMEGSPAIGKELCDLKLTDPQGCLVISVLRDSLPLRPPFDHTTVQENDIIVLYGNHLDLDRAVHMLSQRVHK